MREQLEKRLSELKAEYEAGEKLTLDYETKLANLRNTMLRISGAIQVLEEALGAGAAEGVPPEKTEAG